MEALVCVRKIYLKEKNSKMKRTAQIRRKVKGLSLNELIRLHTIKERNLRRRMDLVPSRFLN